MRRRTPIRRKLLTGLAIGLAAAAMLPLRTDGGQSECCNVASSLASTINNPTAGDEQFFTLPVGPANLMLLLDTSGSMDELPQCGDSDWATDLPTCSWPAALPLRATNGVNGTCSVSGDANLAWMHSYTPTDALVDPGLGLSANGLDDRPTWGTGCVGNACLFQPSQIYGYGQWNESTAVPYPDCRLRTGAAPGTAVSDGAGNPVGPDEAECRRCLFGDASTPPRGFYFYSYRYVDGGGTVRTNRVVLFSGGWLNANPPKFMSARKVVKQTVWIDPARPSNTDVARFGLTYFSGDIANRAQIVVPLGPNKANTYPTNGPAMVQARQLILNALNRRWPTGVTLPSLRSGNTPMGTALFRVGQYFSSLNRYTGWFGSSYELAGYREYVRGTMQAPWAGTSGSNCSVCWGCQTNAAIVVTDGSPNNESGIPGTITTFDPVTFQLGINCGANGSSCIQPVDGRVAVVPRVASWLHQKDLRVDLSVSDPQTVTVSAVSFNVPPGAPQRILQATANMGGGSYSNAADGRELANAVARAVEEIVTRANSFSAPAASSLSTIHTVSSEVFVTRFKPNDTPAWEGHVFQGNLFDEFLAGCDPTRPPDQQAQVRCGAKTVSANFNGDSDAAGNSICTGVFMVDTDCDEIAEDPRTGDFIKKGTGGTPANLVWDAGRVLSDPTRTGYRTAQEGRPNSRVLYTAVPRADGAWDTIAFDSTNLPRFAAFMGLTPDWCLNVLRLARLCGTSTTPACPLVGAWTAAATTQCAEQVVHYVRGWDVLDNDGDGCAGPGNPNNAATCASGALGEQRDRVNDSRPQDKVFWKLGDIFHSSPVLSKPPVSERVCDTGYDNQCVATIRSPGYLPDQTATATYSACRPESSAYEAWRYQWRDRRRILLIGANDGLLHAFDAGIADNSKARDSDCSLPYTQGTGEERWAFVPPDMLPRLKDTLLGHQYTVDGNTMLRDIWVDANRDRVKQRDEFRTVVISTERAGGTQLNALEITDPDRPTFLWTFPPPCSDEAQWMGQSWADFAPRPPPVGPVKLKLSGGATDSKGRDFEERWVAMVNGGYDPAMGAGRAVWMVDAWTGQVLWRYTDDDFKAQNGYGAGTSMFPVPGAVALVDLGDPSRPRFDADGYFDTATWGDMGGNLFVARFHEPGVVDPTTGRVANWHAARTFEQQRRTDDLQYAAGRSPFFFMTTNTYDPQGKSLHTYAGGGNRERIMQQGEACGPDNLVSCCRAGCTADATTTDSYGSCGFQNHFRCENGRYLHEATSASATCGGAAACGAGAGFTSSVRLQFSCPGVGAVPDVTASVSCAADGTCASLSSVGDSQVYTDTSTCPRNRFFGVLSYGRYPEKVFSTAAEAQRFEQNRYTDASFSAAGTCASTGGSCTLVDTTTAQARIDQPYPTCGGGVARCSATSDDPGWFYQYGTTCPVATCPSGGCSNEKTGSAAGVVFGCALWNGFQPVGAQAGNDPCTGSVGTPMVYGYASDFVSGVPTGNCGYNTYPETVLYRAQQRGTVAPPSGGIFRVSVSAKGEVSYSSLQMDPGAAPASTQTGTRSDIAEPVYWLEVSRGLHACRHDPATSTTSCE
jgi:type IV pilus assembly protein PilY1